MTPQSDTLTGFNWPIALVIASVILVCAAVAIIIVIARKKKTTPLDPSGDYGSISKLGSPEIRVFLTLTDDAVVLTDRSLRVVNYNARFRELLNASIIMNNQDLSSLLKMVDSAGQLVALRNLPNFKDRDSITLNQLFILDQTNQKIEVELRLIRMHSKISDQVIYVWALSNISDRKQLEREQSEFISVLSHELRTPVAVVEASTSAILGDQSEDLSPQQHKLIDAVRENALLLSKLLGDLSVYGKLQNGDLSLSTATVSPRMVLEQIKRVFTSQAESKHIALIVDHDQEVKSIKSSEAHILSVLQNFVSNAIQFTQAGGVIIIATKSVADGVIFMVRDTGTGIAPELKPHLFENTFHLNTDTEHSTLKGAGLGLYISSRLAQALGATVWAESEEGQGSTFYLKVPAQFGGKPSNSDLKPAVLPTKD